MSDEKLSNIQSLLEDIKALLLLSNQETITKAKSNLLKPGSVEETVYKLCDGENTINEIMKKIKKNYSYTNMVLIRLRQKGLIRIVEKNGKKIHEQRL